MLQMFIDNKKKGLSLKEDRMIKSFSLASAAKMTGMAVALFFLFGLLSTGGPMAATSSSAACDPKTDPCCCPDGEFCKQMSEASMASVAAQVTTYRETYEQTTAEMRKNALLIQTPFGDIMLENCIETNLGRLEDLIMGILEPGNLLLRALVSALQNLANQVCNYVATAINNALSKVCIPLPNLFGLPGFGLNAKRSTCNGMSLNDLFWVYGTNPISMPGGLPRLENMGPIRPIYRGVKSMDSSLKSYYQGLGK